MAHEIFGADRILKKNRLVAEGLCDSELTRPLVLILCEQGCGEAVEHIKYGILAGGCAAVCVDMPSLTDIAAEGAGKNNLLYARESVADITEALLSINSADGVAIVASSQTAAAGMIMGAVRRNVPLAFLPAFFTGAYHPSLVLNTKARVSSGKAGIAELEDIAYGISRGRSMEMDNLNSLCVFLEGVGIAPHNSVGAYTVDEKICAARQCGEMASRRTTELTCPRKEFNAATVDCGIIAYILAGGTVAGLLDVLAIANENLLDIDLKYIEGLSGKLPRLAAVAPLSRFNICAFARAGGVFALLKEALKIPKLIPPYAKICDESLVDLLDRVDIKRGITNPRGSSGICCCDRRANDELLSYNNKDNSGNLAEGCFDKNGDSAGYNEVICRLENPVNAEGGFGILKGNLFNYGVFCRSVKDKIFKGTAVVFDSEEQLRATVINGLGSSLNGALGGAFGGTSVTSSNNANIAAGGTALILRGQRARDNGMPLLDLQSAVSAAGLTDVVIITDGRVIESGGCPVISLCFGEDLAAVKSGDPIEIDFKKCKINLNVAGKEINNRLKKIKNINETLFGGLLKYAYLVGEPDNGCILRQKF